MTKCLVFIRNDGSKYALPLKLVAEARAKYYAERDKDTTFESEVDFVMRDSWEGADWFLNQCDPEDFGDEFLVLQEADELSLTSLIRESSCSIEEIDLGPKEPDPAKLNALQMQIADAYLEAQLGLLHALKHGELNYIKTAVEMPNGGKYLLQFSHVDGPKTDVQALFKQRAENAAKKKVSI